MARNRVVPREMRVAPALDTELATPAPTPRHALLINPFYAKDPYSSYGKHVLTPTLALSSIAASTPDNWTIEYWDENLLQGHPPCEKFPQVVGITVHLTFAERAYELAAWYRERGAIVIMGGLHVQSCTEECAPHADALVMGEGRGFCQAPVCACCVGGRTQRRWRVWRRQRHQGVSCAALQREGLHHGARARLAVRVRACCRQ